MRTFILAIALLASLNSIAQYNTISNIHYYSPEARSKNSYLDSQCTLDLYFPKDRKAFATIIWLHGGGITGGKKEIPAALMDKGYAVVGVAYRFSPRVSAPAYIEDAAAAIAWTFQHIAGYGGDKKQIVVSGHSAGAYLGMLAGLDKKYLAKYSIDANDIAMLVPFSPQCITHFTVRKESGIRDTQPTVDQYAPLYHVRADAPPLILITGDREMELLGRYEENAYMARMMKLTGHKNTRLYELDGYDHGNMPAGGFPILLRAMKELRTTINNE